MFKRSGSPFYYARWQQQGKDLVVSTKTKDRRKAEEELRRLMKAAMGEVDLDEEFRRLEAALALLDPKARDRKRNELAKRLLAGQQHKLRIADGWSAWLSHPNKKRTPKESTLAGYKAIWDRFVKWSENGHLDFLHEVNERTSQSYAADLWESHVSPSTFNAHIKFLSSLFTVLETEAGLTENIWRKITRKEKALNQGRRNLTLEELKTVLGRAEGNLRAMFTVALFTGLRLGDVANLRWDEIDHDPHNRDVAKRGPKPGFLVVMPLKTSRKGKVVEVPIHTALRSVLDDLRKQSKGGEYLFPAERAEYMGSASGLTKRIQAHFEACGIQTTEEAENGERRRAIVRVGFHSLRHSFVSLCAKAGAPLHVVQKLVGHGSPLLTSEVYNHPDAEQKTAAVAALPDLGVSGAFAAPVEHERLPERISEK